MTTETYEAVWKGVGFLGQGIFTARFLVQWAVSEKKRQAVVPEAFWWISMFGGITLLTYTIHRRDEPLMLGQALGLLVYIRNLMLIYKAKRRTAKQARRAEAQARALAPQGVATVPPRPHRVDSGVSVSAE